MYERKADPTMQPIKGINAWNDPNHTPTTIICFNCTFSVDNPLHIATAKASIASATAISIISKILIFSPK
jgi:hypothetical protein